MSTVLVVRLARAIGGQPPVTFGAVLEQPHATGLLGRWMANGPFAGDHRDWGRVSAWAELIADRLEAPATASAAVPTMSGTLEQ